MLVPLGLLLFSLVFGSEPKESLKTWFEPKIRGYTPPPPTNLRTEHKITRFLRFSSPMAGFPLSQGKVTFSMMKFRFPESRIFEGICF